MLQRGAVARFGRALAGLGLFASSFGLLAMAALGLAGAQTPWQLACALVLVGVPGGWCLGLPVSIILHGLLAIIVVALSDTVTQPAPMFAYTLIGAVLIFGVGVQATLRRAEESGAAEEPPPGP